MPPLLQTTESGLYCSAGDFYIDPWEPVDRAVITHAHADHARWGSRSYLTSETGARMLRERLEEGSVIQSQPYGEPLSMNGVNVSFHPAGHILGSSQVRVEHKEEVWVVSGDYKIERDATCEPFELVPCNTFITESTFGLPIYRWKPQKEVFEEINDWWRGNVARGWTSILYGYALGKAQRLIAGVDPDIGPLLAHGAVMRFVDAYRETGVHLPPVRYADAEAAAEGRGKALVVAPPSAAGTPWLRKFGENSTAFASGWMAIRGARRRRAMDRGFVVSDHADWDDLLATIKATGAESIGVTHGYSGTLVRFLQESGVNAWTMQTRYEGEVEDDPAEQAD
jgi:putative mRNA 3-end processing factor